MPLYSASQTALPEFGEKNLESVPNIDVPFSSLEPTAPPRERNECITLDRLIKYGGAPGCGACSKAGGARTSLCKARFNGLVRADRIASGSRTPRTRGHQRQLLRQLLLKRQRLMLMLNTRVLLPRIFLSARVSILTET